MDEKTISSRTVYDGRIIRLELVEVELADGRRTTREIIRHHGAAVVLAQKPDGDYLFVRQFRKPLDAEILEAVAGTLEPGEAPEVCARRELAEETGCAAASLTHLGTVYPSPGYLEERMELFFARVGDEAGDLGLDHDEELETVCLTRNEVDEAIRSGALFDAKTLAAWLLYEKVTGDDRRIDT